MGIKTVAIYSDADRHSQHVKMADEAVYIGASESSESYLVGEKVIAAAKEVGAQAIHPGYGFLSTNPDFCQQCEDEGVNYIGPGPDAMRTYHHHHHHHSGCGDDAMLVLGAERERERERGHCWAVLVHAVLVHARGWRHRTLLMTCRDVDFALCVGCLC